MLKNHLHFYEIHLSLEITIVLEDRFYFCKVHILWRSHLAENHFHFSLEISFLSCLDKINIILRLNTGI